MTEPDVYESAGCLEVIFTKMIEVHGFFFNNPSNLFFFVLFSLFPFGSLKVVTV